VISSSQRPLHTQRPETWDTFLSHQATPDLRLRPRGHKDRLGRQFTWYHHTEWITSWFQTYPTGYLSIPPTTRITTNGTMPSRRQKDDNNNEDRQDIRAVHESQWGSADDAHQCQTHWQHRHLHVCSHRADWSCLSTSNYGREIDATVGTSTFCSSLIGDCAAGCPTGQLNTDCRRRQAHFSQTLNQTCFRAHPATHLSNAYRGDLIQEIKCQKREDDHSPPPGINLSSI